MILMLHIRTFGGLHISYEGETVSFLSGRNTKMWEVLKYLLACYPKPVTIDKLVEAVWPEGDTGDSGKNIQPTALSKIKKLFDDRSERSGPILCAPDTFTQIYSYTYGKRAEERKLFMVFLCKITLFTALASSSLSS